MTKITISEEGSNPISITLPDNNIKSEEGIFSKSTENREKIKTDFEKHHNELMKKINIIIKKYLNKPSLQNKNTKYDGWDTKNYYISRSQFINKTNDSVISCEKDLDELFKKHDDKLLANGVAILGEKYVFKCAVYGDDRYKDGNRTQNPDGNLWMAGIKIHIKARSLTVIESKKRKN